jgi:ubiquinone/menaquinone biosynthesis C-methylase UbiE
VPPILPEDPEQNSPQKRAFGPGAGPTENSAFDLTAPSFERHRSLPAGASETIRAAIYATAGISPPARVLDIGAGTGRIGRAFVDANDFYIGLDTSLAMLQEFHSRSPRCILVHSEGGQLPFIDGSFDIVLLMQVLSGANDWRSILTEALRVLRPGGYVSVGQIVSSESGVDAQFKRQMRAILDQLQLASHRPGEARGEALAWLKSASETHTHRVAHSWQVTASAQEFLDRHRTGARFAALPCGVQRLVLERLRNWAETTFGSLDTPFPETRSYEVNVFQFQRGAEREFRT